MKHRRRRRLAAVAALLTALGAVFLFAGRAPAEVCVQRDGLVRVLAERFGEGVVARGLASTGQLVELFRNGETETWTLVLTSQSGRSCVLLAGTAWQTKKPVLGRPS